MHLINPSATRQFLSARLEDESVSPGEIETAERWLNVAVCLQHTTHYMPQFSLTSDPGNLARQAVSSYSIAHD